MNDEILTSQPMVDARARPAVTPLAIEQTVEGIAKREKFDLHRRSEPLRLDSAPLPWGYGHDRITVLVRSPDSVYLYWEITDAGITRARDRLGPAGEHGWFNLRVYDTTGREFDGTNANSYVDMRVDRAQRELYLAVNRPGSAMHAEIGVMSHEGFFQPIARSGRGDFPRKSPSPNTSLEWMTVTDGNEHPVAAPYYSRYAGPERSPFAGEGEGPASQPPASSQDASTHATPANGGAQVYTTNVSHGERAVSWSVSRSFTSEWVTLSPHDIGQVVELASFFRSWQTQWRTDLRFLRWLGKWPGAGEPALPQGGTLLAWHAGPFPVEIGDVHRVEIREDGVPIVIPADWGQLQIAGPWHVTIRGMKTEPVRRVLATWTMHVVRKTPVFAERWLTSIERVRYHEEEQSYEQIVVGASEVLAIQHGGASEAFRLGASERLWQGASEWRLLGASETLSLGASERALFGLGASALFARGASEWVMAGASELRLMGGSEAVSLEMGGSEAVALGASLGFALGGTESIGRVLGGSEAVAVGLGGSASLALGASEAHASSLGGASERVLGSSDVLPLGSSDGLPPGRSEGSTR